MRTTVTLEPDVEHYIRKACHKRKASFKRVLNDTLREALKPPSPAPSLLPPKSMGLAPGIDPGKLNALADELEVEGFLEAESKRRHGNRPADP